MMRAAKLLVVSLCSALLLTGCWDIKNIQDLLYATAIGVDYKDDQYQAYIQIVAFSHVAKSENAGGNGGPQVYIGRGKGKTLSLALGNLYETVQRRLFWSHVRALLFTERAIQAGGGDYFDNLKRYREFRYTPWIFGTKETIEDIFKTPSYFQMSPIQTILGTPEDNYIQRSYIKPLFAQEYQIRLNEPGDTALVPTLAIDKSVWESDRKSEPKLKMNGVFAVHNHDFQGWLGDKEVSGLRWMTKSTSRTAVETKDAILSLEKPRPRIKVSLQDGKTVFNITVQVRGNVVELLSDRPSEHELEKEAEERIKQEIRSTYEAGLRIGADVYSFKNVLFKRRYANWKTVQLTPQSLRQIDVQVNIQHTGELQKKS
ncbi:Ger(x)C family spore germination protein [Paenibacillus silvisoli]|uniref:Ger(x)C family spore germination protein n=1 Tax=Paenibacillus silvisoli TaxID=3110539 RepID=UPI002805AC66|nr:Ger(x)C family spore germination protein [Paenibacillus silvisoli]